MAKLRSAPLISGMSGQLGNVVLVAQPFGTVMRERVVPKNPRTPAQHAWRTAMKRAGEAYRSLTLEQFKAWELYCQSIADPGERMVPVVQVFMKLGAKAWQVQSQLGPESGDSDTEIRNRPLSTPALKPSPCLSNAKDSDGLDFVPLWPPNSPFGGDGITVSASAGSSGVRFEASAANAFGVATELLLQSVTSLFAATFDSHYRSQGFAVFNAGSLVVDVPVAAGYYACAVRFVKVSTGEQTGILRLGTVRVEQGT